jgi:hypothetical protein
MAYWLGIEVELYWAAVAWVLQLEFANESRLVLLIPDAHWWECSLLAHSLQVLKSKQASLSTAMLVLGKETSVSPKQFPQVYQFPEVHSFLTNPG